jgi:adsorption protein B
MMLLVTDILTVLHLLAQVLFLVAGVAFAISAIDDLCIDLFFFIHHGLRQYRLKFKYTPLSLDQLVAKPEQPLALMLPAWQEADVLYNAVHNLIHTIRYSNYHVFIGTYPNDAATQSEVDKLVSTCSNVHKVVTRLPGPTCKADCLNAIIAAVDDFEKTHGFEFAAVVMQDAEDVIHPLSLKLFNYLVPRFDLVQIPVFSLPREWTKLTGGHYMDEFAEVHSKEILVREHFAGIVPGAGVGTAYSRRALALAAEQDEIFNTNSLTEDYEFSVRLHDAGLKQVFARVPITQTMTVTDSQGRKRDISVTEFIATREYFPSRFWAAVRQKTRWTIGISLQGWQSLGWRGNWRVRYLFWRDRKMLFFSHAILLGYISVVIFGGLYAYEKLSPDSYRLAPLLAAEHPFWSIVFFNLLLVAYRIVQRHIWTSRYYGWSALPMVLPRYIWGAVINYFAICRAIKIFLKHLVTGQKIGWDKTAHDFPEAAKLTGLKRRLGELLLEGNYLSREALDTVLDEQQRTGQRLGKLLLARGLVKENQLMQALSSQFRLPVKSIDASILSPAVYGVLPFDTLREYRLMPLERNQEGVLVVACEILPDAVLAARLEHATGCHIAFCLATESDISYGLHLLATVELRQVQGDMPDDTAMDVGPCHTGLLAEPQLLEAFHKQREQYKPFGVYAVEQGYLNQRQLDESVTAAARAKVPLGTYLVKHDYISEEACVQILAAMSHTRQQLSHILVGTNIFLKDGLEEGKNREMVG